ncbi:MAG: CHASE domain-containing protein [Fuerstiella sp.]
MNNTPSRGTNANTHSQQQAPPSQGTCGSLGSCITRLMPGMVLCTTLVASAIVWYQTDRYIDKVASDRFSERVAHTKGLIECRMLEYEQVLRGGVALHHASSTVSRNEWNVFIEECEIQKWFPGIQCIGFAVPVAKNKVADYEQSIRNEGFDDFKITPTHVREQYTAITFIEPFDWRNKRAFGYDMYSNSVRRKAMDRAAATGLASISGKITLVQETDEEVQSGILCYLPLYDSHARLSSEKSRKEALIGWVYAAFRCRDLMAGILDQQSRILNLELYDNNSVSSDDLLFDTRPTDAASLAAVSRLSAVVPIRLSGRDWAMRVSSRPAFFSAAENFVGPCVGIIGIVVSVLLYLVLSSITRQRTNAVRLAQWMTRGLVESEQRTRYVLENASEAILSVNERGEISAANQAAQAMFQCPQSLVGEKLNDLLVNCTFKDLIKQCVNSKCSIVANCKRSEGESFPCWVSIDEGKLNGKTNFVVVARDETERVKAADELAEKNKQLIEASRVAGMAEVATSVLHNVGNVLNSVNVSANMLRQRVDGSAILTLEKATSVIDEHRDDLGHFFTKDPRGQHFPRLMNQLVLSFQKEQGQQLGELGSLTDNIAHIKEIISMQQSAARKSGLTEAVEPVELFEDALRMNAPELDSHGVIVVRNFAVVPAIETSKHEVLQILVNLIRNARQAVNMSDGSESTVQVSLLEQAGCIHFQVKDSGIGIAPENLNRIFQHGFTTKATGHGFGLHSCANTAQQLQGSLAVESEGTGKGATFELILPIKAIAADAMAPDAMPADTPDPPIPKSPDAHILESQVI